MNQIYIGIDGARTGWIVSEVSNKKLDITWIKSLSEVNLRNIKNIKTALIDMPLKLPITLNDYPRMADKKAKKLLTNRHSCIFYAPLEKWLNEDYVLINEECERSNKPKCSKQSYNLFSKIRELREFYNKTPKLNLKEHHPELIFKFFNNNLSLLSKHSLEGIHQRKNIIQNLLKYCEVSNVAYLQPSSKLGFTIIDQVDAVILSLYARYNDIKKSTHESELLDLFDSKY